MKAIMGIATVIAFLAMTGCQVASKTQSGDRPAEPVQYMTLDEFQSTLADRGDVVLVEFRVPSGCSRCDEMRASIDRLASDRRELLTVRRVNLNQHLQLAWEFDLTACPSYVAFRDGEEVFRATYPTSADLIASRLDESLRDSSADQLSLTVQ